MTSSELDPRLSSILETCLEAIQSGRATFQECLDRYPAEAPQIQRELRMAVMAARLKAAAVMPDASVNRLEARLRTQFKQQIKPVTLKTRPVRRRLPVFAGKWAAAFMIAFLLALGAGGGAVAASANSLPGETLYSVKRAWESFVVLVATLIGRADDVWLHLAQVRFEELMKLAEKGGLSNRVLEEFSNTLEETIQAADEATTPDLVVFMMNAESQLQLALPSVEPLPGYDRMVSLLKPLFDDSGRLQVRSVVTITTPEPPSATPVLPNPSATATLTPTFTPTATYTPTATATDLPTNTPQQPTATSRFPATATRTPSPVPSETASATPTNTPTMTWTPLPLPGGTRIVPTPVPEQTQSSTIIQITPVVTDGGDPIRIRETQGAVYATQTAIAGGAGDPTATTDPANP